MDDQRCSLADPLVGDNDPLVSSDGVKNSYSNAEVAVAPQNLIGQNGQGAAKEELLDMIAGAQSSRLNEQRAPWSVLPGLTRS